ncbi:MAG: hypothetical protein FWH22_08870 [Fibromonadales bacterium]|nr:hypothetical protein [Fibromonadales bacterium]
MNFPNWLVWIDKNLKWLSIPKLPLTLTLLQALGFILVMLRPGFDEQLALDPGKVFQGEIWRLFTFIANPLTESLLVIFVLWFIYNILLWLEDAWGSTLLTVYFLFAWFSTILASVLTGLPIKTFVYMECSFFFAVATINPNKEIYLFFILPIAFKWIAIFIAAVLFIVPLVLGSYEGLFFLTLFFANYLLFFGKHYWILLKRELERRKS